MVDISEGSRVRFFYRVLRRRLDLPEGDEPPS